MKKGIHPEYKDVQVTCGCGNSFRTRSTKERIAIEICSNCHPFYTGKQKFVDTAGMIEKFQRRWQGDEAKKKAQQGKPAKKAPAKPKVPESARTGTIAAQLAPNKPAEPQPPAPKS